MSKNLSKRRLAALSAPVLLAFSLTACGGGASGAPTDASKDDFCNVFSGDFDTDAFDPEASPEDQAKALKEILDEQVSDYQDVGTPEDIPDDAREGFEISVDAAGDVSEDDIQDAFENPDGDFSDLGVSEDDQDKVAAFNSWAIEYCGAGDLGDIDLPDLSDAPDLSDIPELTDLPTP